MKRLKTLGILAGVGLCAAVVFAGGSKARAAEDPVIADGVFIGNVDVSGMNEEEAHAAVDSYVESLLDTTFTLSGENGSIEMTAADMKVAADADTAVSMAMNVGRAGRWRI